MGLPRRLLMAFTAPGKLMEELAEHPRWVGALFLTTAVVGLSLAVIPVDLIIEANRQAAMERGTDLPEFGERAVNMMRIVVPVGAMVGSLLFTVVFTAVCTFVFVFVLGDEGRFAQYLAAVSHAYFIPALFGLLVTPLRISTGDPQFTLNLASFFGFLPDGYFLHFLKVFDLTQIWSLLVIAQGVHAVDRRRSFVSAASILLGLFSALALVIARFM
jgi:hypothetical protein